MPLSLPLLAGVGWALELVSLVDLRRRGRLLPRSELLLEAVLLPPESGPFPPEPGPRLVVARVSLAWWLAFLAGLLSTDPPLP